MAAIEGGADTALRALIPELMEEGLLGYTKAHPLECTLLNHALDQAQAGAARLLLNAGAEPDARDYRGKTPLMKAVFNEGLCRAVLAAGANIGARDTYRQTALHHAARDMRATVGVVRLLLRRGAEVNARDSAGRTALHHAAINGYLDKVNALLSARADPNIRGIGLVGTPLEDLTENRSNVPLSRRKSVNGIVARLSKVTGA